ncbi:MAG: SufE family protein [Rhodobacteraceae bacterium]|nr:SufE family protein [Paracoccaceae bacterium]
MASKQFEEIAEDFEFLDEWEDRYRYVIDLGKKMADMDPAHKIDATKVHGCASQVWIMPEIEGQGSNAIIRFTGDSDAMIVRGLIAVLHALYNGLSAREAVAVDALAEMGRLGLDQHLSAQRSNGLRAMIERLDGIAAKLVG